MEEREAGQGQQKTMKIKKPTNFFSSHCYKIQHLELLFNFLSTNKHIQVIYAINSSSEGNLTVNRMYCGCDINFIYLMASFPPRVHC